MRSVTAAQAKCIDAIAREQFAIPGILLMENAGLRAADVIRDKAVRSGKKKICVCCGPGNNGGDGYAVARHLKIAGMNVQVICLVPEQTIRADARVMYMIVKKMGIPVVSVVDGKQMKRLFRLLRNTDCIVDAVFGVGLNKEVTGHFKNAIERINGARKCIISLDVPSGLCATTGRVWGMCVRAAVTVTFGAAKKGFFRAEGPDHAGDIVLADIGWPRALLCRTAGVGRIKRACK